MMERYDPYLDPDASGCPHGCGRLTDDPYGGPCSRCWAALDEEQDAKAEWYDERSATPEPTSGIPDGDGAAERFKASRAEGRDTVESLVRAIIPGVW